MVKLSVVFDLCDTLVKGNTTFMFLDHILRDNPLYTMYRRLSRLLPFRIIFKLLSLINVDLNRRIALLFLKGMTKELLQSNANALVRDEFVFEQDIVVLIKMLNEKGIPVYIVSASLDIIVSTVADKFGVHFISSSLGFENDICSGELVNDLLYKKNALFDSSDSRYPSLAYDTLIFVSDNIQDMTVLKKARFGFGYYTKKNKRKFSTSNIDKFEKNKIISLIDKIDESTLISKELK